MYSGQLTDRRTYTQKPKISAFSLLEFPTKNYHFFSKVLKNTLSRSLKSHLDSIKEGGKNREKIKTILSRISRISERYNERIFFNLLKDRKINNMIKRYSFRIIEEKLNKLFLKRKKLPFDVLNKRCLSAKMQQFQVKKLQTFVARKLQTHKLIALEKMKVYKNQNSRKAQLFEKILKNLLQKRITGTFYRLRQCRENIEDEPKQQKLLKKCTSDTNLFNSESITTDLNKERSKIEHLKNLNSSYKRQLQMVKSELESMKQLNEHYEKEMQVFCQAPQLQEKIQILEKERNKYKERSKQYHKQIVQMKEQFRVRIQTLHIKLKKQIFQI